MLSKTSNPSELIENPLSQYKNEFGSVPIHLESIIPIQNWDSNSSKSISNRISQYKNDLTATRIQSLALEIKSNNLKSHYHDWESFPKSMIWWSNTWNRIGQLEVILSYDSIFIRMQFQISNSSVSDRNQSDNELQTPNPTRPSYELCSVADGSLRQRIQICFLHKK